MKTFAIVALVLLLTGCGVTGEAVREPTQPRIGGLFSLTGFASFAGESSRDGFLLAIEEHELDVKPVIEDTQSDMKATLTAARKLTSMDDVDIIVGPEWEFGAVVSPLAAQGEALFVSPWLTLNQEWTEPELFLSAMPREEVYSQAFAEWIADQGVKRIALIRTKDDFALTVERTLQAALAERGVEIVATFPVEADAKSFQAELAKAAALEPDMLYTLMQSDDAQVLITKQLRELGLEMPHLINYARGESDGFLGPAGESGDGVIFAAPKEFERLDEFREKFREHYGREMVAISAATAYDVTTLILDAMAEGARTPEEVREFLEETKRVGYSGVLDFEDGFIAGGESVIKQVVDGERRIIA